MLLSVVCIVSVLLPSNLNEMLAPLRVVSEDIIGCIEIEL
jgi:uncharacterized membrane-anchored protein